MIKTFIKYIVSRPKRHLFAVTYYDRFEAIDAIIRWHRVGHQKGLRCKAGITRERGERIYVRFEFYGSRNDFFMLRLSFTS